MKKQVKKIAVIAASVIAVVMTAVTLLLPMSLEAVQIQPKAVSLTFTEQGSYGYRQLYTVYPLVSGEVLEVRVKEGQRVSAGDVIAVINASDYQYQIEQLKSTINAYNGQISNLYLQEQQQKTQLSAELEGLRSKMVEFESDMSKGALSLKEQIEIQEDIIHYNSNLVRSYKEKLSDAEDEDEDSYASEELRLAYNTARNTLAHSRVLLEQLKAGEVAGDVYDAQKLALESQIGAVSAQLDGSYSGGMYQYYNAQIAAAQSSIAQMEEKAGQAEIKAPIDGVVSQLPIQDQNIISQQGPVAVIGSNDYCVEAYIPIRDIDSVKLGDTVELTLDKRLEKETISGSVTWVDSEAQVKLSALGIEERKVRVRIRPIGENPPVGADLDVRFTVGSWEDVLTVPKTAVFQMEDGDYVWVIANGKLEARRITKGVETKDAFIVEDGLAPGDIVVADSDNADISEGKRASAKLT